jgi:hypothetical protein
VVGFASRAFLDWENIAQVNAGDAWYELGRKHPFGAGFNARARHWYKKALPNARSLTKTHLTKRLEEIGEK